MMTGPRAALAAITYTLGIALFCCCTTNALYGIQNTENNVIHHEKFKKKMLIWLDGCRPQSVGRDCNVLSQAFGYSSLPETLYRCPKLNGDFPLREDRQRFYRCRDGFFTVEDCGESYHFDPVRHYCIPLQKSGSVKSQPSSDASKAKRKDSGPSPDNTGKAASPPGANVATAGAGGSSRYAELTCVDGVPASEWNTSGTVGGCWKEALRRGAVQLLIGPSGCAYRDRPVSRTGAKPCTPSSVHVLESKRLREELLSLNSRAPFSFTGKSATGIDWNTVRIAVKSSTARTFSLADCLNSCMKTGSEFARADGSGCHCGTVSGPAPVLHADVDFSKAVPASVNPGITVKLRISDSACPRRPFSRLVSVGDAVLADCAKLPSAGNNSKRNRNCALALASARRLALAQCSMYYKKPSSALRLSQSYTSNDTRVMSADSSGFRECGFWWVPEVPLKLVWRPAGRVVTLEDCVLLCKDRFVLAGPTTCACGSVNSTYPDFDVKSWVKAQNTKPLQPGEGFLLHDRDAVIAGFWSCTTEPDKWTHYPVKSFKHCLEKCRNTSKPYAAFGKSGCRCGSPAEASPGFHSLPMAECQKAKGAGKAFSMVFAEIASFHGRISKALEESLWAGERPVGIRWRSEPRGHRHPQDCSEACLSGGSVGWVLFGVMGCECGSPGHLSGQKGLQWTLESQDGSDHNPARGFLLLKVKDKVTGLSPKRFRWKRGTMGETQRARTSLYNFEENGRVLKEYFNNMHGDSSFKNLLKIVHLNSPEARVLQESSVSAMSFARNTLFSRDGRLKYGSLEGKRETGKYTKSMVAMEGQKPLARKINGKSVIRANQTNGDESRYRAATYRISETWKEDGSRNSRVQYQGAVFAINAMPFAKCFRGEANESLWQPSEPDAESLSKCICACRNTKPINKQQEQKSRALLIAAIMKRGKCFCSTSSQEIGDLVSSVPMPATCPESSVRAVFVSVQSAPAKRLCDAKTANGAFRGAAIIGPGQHGKFRRVEQTRFYGRSTTGFNLEKLMHKVTLTSHEGLSYAGVAVRRHEKRGVAGSVHAGFLAAGVAPRTFSLSWRWSELTKFQERYLSVGTLGRKQVKWDRRPLSVVRG